MSRQKEFKWQKIRVANDKGKFTYNHKLINFPLYEISFRSFISEKTHNRIYEFDNPYGKNLYYDNINDCIKQVLKSFIDKEINDSYFHRYCYSIGQIDVSYHYRYHHYNVPDELAQKTVKDYEITALRHKKRFINLYQKLYDNT